MTHKVDYKKIRTDIINGKKRCIYMKPKGKREYVKSGGEFVSLSAYIKTLQKKNKKKGGGDGDEDYQGPQVPQNSRQSSPQSSPRKETAGTTTKRINDMALNYRNLHINPQSSHQSSPHAVSTKRPLPDGWGEKMSASKGVPYYVNKETGKSTWTHPSSM
jgi:hypothetical protein